LKGYSNRPFLSPAHAPSTKPHAAGRGTPGLTVVPIFSTAASEIR
jgi:hypothetical protein